MKKLLSFLGAITITASASATVVACGKPAGQKQNEIATDGLSQVMQDYSKLLFLNQNEINGVHVSSSSYLKVNLMNQKLSSLGMDKLAINEGLDSNATYNDVANKYFDVNNLTSGVTVSDNIYQGGVESLENQMDSTIATLLGQLTNITNPSGLLSLLTSFDMEQMLAPGGLLESFKDVLSKDNLQLLENAFSTDVYVGMTMQQTMDSSVIGLANALDQLMGEGKLNLEYSKEKLEANYKTAISSIGENVGGLLSGEKSISFDIATNIPALAEIIRFVRTILINLNQFGDLTTETIKTKKEIKEIRSKTFDSSDNKLNLKNLVSSLKFLVNDDNGYYVIKNVLASLFVSVEDTGVLGGVSPFEEYNEGNDGYADLLASILEKVAGMETVDTGMDEPFMEIDLSTVYIKAFIRAFINIGAYGADDSIGAGFVLSALAYEDTLEEGIIKDLVSKINGGLYEGAYTVGAEVSEEYQSFIVDWVSYLWTNDNKELNFNLKSLLDQPLSGLMNLFGGTTNKFDNITSSGFDFLTSKSLKEIVNDLDAQMVELTDEQATVDFGELANIIGEIKNKIDDALANPKDFWKILGYEGKDKYTPGSAFDLLDKFLKKAGWLESVGKVIDSYLSVYAGKIRKLNTDAKTLFNSLNVTKESSNNDKFVYSVTDGKITNKFEITLTGETGNKVIKSIALL
ncbi:hypothetical protein SCHIN_v1c05550 [Spiroplasma chinense]|uniref:MOLPALP family lipoprotein n=1 Tax=Spiroplasma chinense TaxID=216932 RepID=A0A5B9Y6P0_9MOLU|nr:lipoprotein [Spiroplasma chinense]QEH61752.1 hypothetical protein SCHIN_v1c05550 [Spiroplasma chinense]